MLASFNCSVLSDTSDSLDADSLDADSLDADAFSVNIYKDDNEKKLFTELNNKSYDFESFKVDHLKDYICVRKNVADSDKHAVKLWKVDVKDESDIKEKSKKGIEMKPRLLFKDYFQDELNGVKFTVSNIHVIAIVPTTDTPNKRIKLEDRTTDFLNELLHPFDVEINRTNVEQLLSEPLRRKLPILPGIVTGFSDILEDTLESSIYSPRLSQIVGEVMGKSFKQHPGDEAKTMGNIDTIIGKIIELAQEFAGNCRDLELNRNRAIKSSTTTTENKRDRPDMTIYYNRVLLIMGEEKDLDTKLEEAENQLDGYFDYWNPLAFGRLPLVMAFVAAGTRLQFYYYYPNNNEPVRERIGESIDLGTANRMNNYMALQYTINAIRIIQTWGQNQYIQIPKIKLYEVISRKNDTSITISPKKIIKKVHIEDREPAYQIFFEEFYTNIFPRLGKYKLLLSKFYKRWIHLEFAPVGYKTIPENENELREAIQDVLNVVKNLHENEIVHRDIRWENVIKLTNGGWILIDFEEAAPIGGGKRRTPTLDIADPEYKRDGEDPCRVAGDIWMVGNLLDDSRIRFQLSESALIHWIS